MRSTALVVAAALASTGCLENTHRIPRSELMRLASLPPVERGERVRVIQDLVGDAPPPVDPVNADTQIVIVPDVEVGVGVDVDGGHHGHPGSGPGKPGFGGHPDVGQVKAEDAWVLFLAAAGIGVALAVIEGTRYDGWVQLHPMMPVHLWGPGGYEVLPLAQLDPATAAWATRAVVVPSEGPWHPLGRAPLDRAGMTYTVLIGAAETASGDGTLGLGTAGRVQFGYFPIHAVGLQLDWGFSFRRDRVGATLYDNRLGGELTFAPLDVGHVHGGVFGGVASASRWEDVANGRRDDTALSGGALLQLELTTRLALTGRFAIDRAFGETTRGALIGFSIY